MKEPTTKLGGLFVIVWAMCWAMSRFVVGIFAPLYRKGL